MCWERLCVAERCTAPVLYRSHSSQFGCAGGRIISLLHCGCTYFVHRLLLLSFSTHFFFEATSNNNNSHSRRSQRGKTFDFVLCSADGSSMYSPPLALSLDVAVVCATLVTCTNVIAHFVICTATGFVCSTLNDLRGDKGIDRRRRYTHPQCSVVLLRSTWFLSFFFSLSLSCLLIGRCCASPAACTVEHCLLSPTTSSYSSLVLYNWCWSSSKKTTTTRRRRRRTLTTSITMPNIIQVLQTD